MKKVRRILKTDGFTTFDCGIGACPEVKQIGGEYVIRSSRSPQSEIIFNKDELASLKTALEYYL